MPSFLERVASSLGGTFASYRGHDDKFHITSPAFKSRPKPTITITSPECGPFKISLQIHYTPLGENRFPELTWNPSASTNEESSPRRARITEYLIIVEDPDAPLPMPVTHGIYYAIPPSNTQLAPGDFAAVSGSRNDVHGGFKYGLNRRKIIWSGPKPVLGHGQHRYIFQVVGLSSSVGRGVP